MGNGPLDRVDLAGRCASCAGLWGLGDRALGLAAERDRHAFADGGGYSREHAQGVALVVGVFEAGDDGLGRADARSQGFLRESVSLAKVVNGLCDADGYLCGANRAGPAWSLAEELVDRGCDWSSRTMVLAREASLRVRTRSYASKSRSMPR